MNPNQESRRPQPVAGIDARSLPISPEEAFVLSRVDGKASASDIAASTGLSSEKVTQVLERLEGLNAIRYGDPVRRSGPVARATNGEASEPAAALVEPPPAWTALSDPREALYDPAELDRPGAIERERKQLILDVFHRLDTLSHYELLGVVETADKKRIKSAYYAAVNVFHPDRYFGKDLGPFKPKLEKVFRRLTEAHDALNSEETRREYDRYLQARRRTLGYEGTTAEVLRKAEVERARAEIEEAARVAQAATNTAGSSPRIERVSDPGERRRALARKLSGSRAVRSSIPPEAERSVPPPVDMEQQRKRVAEELKRRYRQHLLKARDAQVARYVRDAKQALLAKDAVSSANLLKIALSLNPGDVSVEAELAEVERMASGELFSSYLEQARYEEREQRPLEAARSYQRAARIKPQAALWERAAHCFLEAESEPNLAIELAKKAVAEGGSDKLASYRFTLARAYLARGMKQSAIAELERARELEPNNDTIKDWLRRAKRHESGA